MEDLSFLKATQPSKTIHNFFSKDFLAEGTYRYKKWFVNVQFGLLNTVWVVVILKDQNWNHSMNFNHTFLTYPEIKPDFVFADDQIVYRKKFQRSELKAQHVRDAMDAFLDVCEEMSGRLVA